MWISEELSMRFFELQNTYRQTGKYAGASPDAISDKRNRWRRHTTRKGQIVCCGSGDVWHGCNSNEQTRCLDSFASRERFGLHERERWHEVDVVATRRGRHKHNQRCARSRKTALRQFSSDRPSWQTSEAMLSRSARVVLRGNLATEGVIYAPETHAPLAREPRRPQAAWRIR
jgi:hypothetical protein